MWQRQIHLPLRSGHRLEQRRRLRIVDEDDVRRFEDGTQPLGVAALTSS